ncbi:MAG: hypothetical protein HQL46_05910 [Gammaproteobacteria bacterium]|nr:hypothetical protein [Gammaproteobacteria bacterium]
MKRIISLLVLSAGLIIILLTIGDLGDILDETQKQKNTTDFGVIKNCDPGNAICSIRSQFEQKSVKISISFDQPIVVLKPFKINLQVEGISPQRIQQAIIDFTMVDMDMGINNQFFKMLSVNGEQNSRWLASGNLAVCVSGRSDWLATITIQVKDKNIKILIPIIAHRH